MTQSKRWRWNLAFVALVLAMLAPVVHALEVGDKAPDFELDSTKGGKLKLSNLKGRNVLINFYVFDYSPT